MSTNKPIRRIAIIGTGVIGASWTALFLAKGLDVVATDVAPDAETSLRRFVKAAWPALERLGLAPGASQSHLTFTGDLPIAMAGADLVQVYTGFIYGGPFVARTLARTTKDEG